MLKTSQGVVSPLWRVRLQPDDMQSIPKLNYPASYAKNNNLFYLYVIYLLLASVMDDESSRVLS